MKKLLLIILPIIAAALYYLLPQQTIKVKQKIDITQELKKNLNKATIENAIVNATNSREYEEAESFIALAKDLNITINPTLVKKLEDKSSSVDEYIDKGKDFINGFLSGKSKNMATLAGSVTSDFTLVGDIRDIYKEGGAYIQGKNYDKFTLSLSVLGLGLTAATIGTFSAAAIPKSGVSILKTAKKSKALSKNFSKVVAKKLEKSVDLQMLKQVDFSSLKGIKNSSKVFKKAIHTKPIKALLKDINSIQKNTSTVEAIKILKYIDNEKELAKAVKVTKKYKKSSYAVFKTLGKGVFRGAKFIVKKSALYLPILIGLITSMLFWIILLLRFIFKPIFS